MFWRWLKIGLLAAALTAFATAASVEVVRQRRSAELERVRTAVGAEEMPPAAPISFALPERGGGTLDLAQLKGKVVVVTFWASWCPPCRAEEPSLRKLSRRFSRDSFQLVAVSVDDGWGPVDEFYAGVGKPPYRVALDREGAVSRSWGTTRFPESYVLDADGNLRLKFLGARDWTDLDMLTLLQSTGARGL